MFKSEKVNALRSQLTWTHYRLLLSFDDVNKINYYIELSITSNLSTRELQSKINNKEYERLPLTTRNKLVSNTNLEVQDLVKDPIIIKNTSNIEIISEKVLKQLILEDLDNFLLELGNGFTYIANEYKIKVDNNFNYIDKNIKTIYQDKTIGIIISKKNNKYVIEYSSDPRIYITTYET